jgi:hypothetical protein
MPPARSPVLFLFRLAAAVSLAAAVGAPAQSPKSGVVANGQESAAKAAAALNLPRLKAQGGRNQAPALLPSQVAIDELPTLDKSSVREVTDRNVRHLVLDAGTSWSRPLRGGPKDTVFVSFLAYGSEGTVIEVAGARLRLQAASQPGFAQLAVGKTVNRKVQWIKFGGPIKLEPHSGNLLAAPPVLTVRIDRGSGVWDLYLANRLALADQALAELPAGASNQFTLRAGSAGALIASLVSASENPIFEDENLNGVDDTFERQGRGTLLAAKAPAAERSALVRQWQQQQQRQQVRPWPIQRPLPDGTPNGPRAKQ